MLRSRKARLARLTASRMWADNDAAGRRATLEARIAIASAVRVSLTQLGIDPTTVAALRRSDETARELAMTAAPRKPDGDAAGWESRIERMALFYRDGGAIDFVHASLAQILAWCVSQTATTPGRKAPPRC